jgi:hypothetical protein
LGERGLKGEPHTIRCSGDFFRCSDGSGDFGQPIAFASFSTQKVTGMRPDLAPSAVFAPVPSGFGRLDACPIERAPAFQFQTAP